LSKKKAVIVLSIVAIAGISAVILLNSGIIGGSENSYIHLSASKYRLDVGDGITFSVSSNFINASLGLMQNSSAGWLFEYTVNTNSSGMWKGGSCESEIPQTLAFCCVSYYRNVTSNIIYVTWIEPTYPIP
jgi:hypothetical protein